MNHQLTVYDLATGEILEIHQSSAPIVLPPLGPGKGTVPGLGSREKFVIGGVMQPRPRMSISLQGNVLRGVPPGAKIAVEKEEYIADGTEVELDFEFPGVYSLEISLWPYMPEVITYEVAA